jgi:soluble lytic murein transglycosylase-like protein
MPTISDLKEPFLYGQVVDQTGQPIRWEGRATKFADYLLQTRLKSRSTACDYLQRHHQPGAEPPRQTCA